MENELRSVNFKYHKKHNGSEMNVREKRVRAVALAVMLALGLLLTTAVFTHSNKPKEPSGFFSLRFAEGQEETFTLHIEKIKE
jgi:hypothetical protein